MNRDRRMTHEDFAARIEAVELDLRHTLESTLPTREVDASTLRAYIAWLKFKRTVVGRPMYERSGLAV
jgi:hypothetical protein